jgi:PAS domain S-box-containing protein
MNRVAENYLGWSEHQALGQPLDGILQLLDEHSRLPVNDSVAQPRDHGHAAAASARRTTLVDRRGNERAIEYTSAPIMAGSGSVFGDIKVLRDVTQQRQAERELRDASQRKDAFLATLAHELRNPLAPIRNAGEILKHPSQSTALAEQACATMDRQVNQMVRLVDDLLDVSRISRGTLQLRRSRVELASVMHDALEMCRPLCESLKVQLQVTLLDEPLELDGDPIRLTQVFSNLLNNACKFSNNHGCVTVNIDVEREHNDVLITVTDNGIGIPADKLTSIFEMFTQVDPSIDRPHGGLGIGLTLVKQIVELHGGSVEARSDGSGQGSRFTVRLPLVRPTEATLELPDFRVQRGAATVCRILVVDDNEDSANSLAMLLKLMGHVTRAAYDGIQALADAQDFCPDLIFLDIGLPKVDGYEVCRQLREQGWGANVHVVALTGWGQAEDRQKSADAGFDEHLVKPVDHHVLGRILAEYAEKRRIASP